MRFIKAYKQYSGILKLSKDIESILLTSKYLEGRFYRVWLELSEYQRAKLMSQITTKIREELLSKDFLRAIAKDILNNGSIAVESNIFKYLKVKVYRGDTRSLLLNLQSVLGDNND